MGKGIGLNRNLYPIPVGCKYAKKNNFLLNLWGFNVFVFPVNLKEKPYTSYIVCNDSDAQGISRGST